MSRYRERIGRIEGTAPRPLWSVMIPTYNCAGYLRETLESVLDQDPGRERMQIEVIDDASSDDPAEGVAEFGRGRVDFFRQKQNVGHVRNFNTCILRSRGHLVHLLHGDDLVLPGFYAAMERVFARGPEIGAAFCRHVYVDENGHPRRTSKVEQPAAGRLDNALERLASQQCIQPPSIVVRREVYEALGGFDRRMLTCGEDWEMWVRIASHKPIAYEPTVLAGYRKHGDSLASRSFRTGQNLRDVRVAIGIFSRHLPADRADELTKEARESAARWGLETAKRAQARRDWRTMLVQLFEVLRTSRSRSVRREIRRLLRATLNRHDPRLLPTGSMDSRP